jgi:hypothetical protein
MPNIRDNSRPIDFFLLLEGDMQFDTLALEITQKIEGSENRKQRSLRDKKKFESSVKLLIANILKGKTLQSESASQLAIPLQTSFYSNTSKAPNYVTYASFVEGAYNGLQKLGYIKIVTNGYYDKETHAGYLTRIKGTERLFEKLRPLINRPIVSFTRHPDEQLIRLRDKDKKIQSYRHNQFTKRAKKNLEKINSCLARHWYDLALTSDRMEQLKQRLSAQHEADSSRTPYIDLNARSLYRVFNNSSFEHGGRFYGGWWQNIPKDFRPYITINGKATVELDYSALHPTILYHTKEINFEQSPYDIEGITASREYIKTAFNALLNSSGRINKPTNYVEQVEGISWKDLLHKIEEHHAPISEYFRTGAGLDLQLIDSQILQSVLLFFAEKNIPCLPIHDSVIIHHAYKDELLNVMADKYSEALENKIGIKSKDNRETVLRNFDWANMNDREGSIDSLLDNMPVSEQRLSYWHSLN